MLTGVGAGISRAATADRTGMIRRCWFRVAEAKEFKMRRYGGLLALYYFKGRRIPCESPIRFNLKSRLFSNFAVHCSGELLRKIKELILERTFQIGNL